LQRRPAERAHVRSALKERDNAFGNVVWVIHPWCVTGSSHELELGVGNVTCEFAGDVGSAHWILLAPQEMRRRPHLREQCRGKECLVLDVAQSSMSLDGEFEAYEGQVAGLLRAGLLDTTDGLEPAAALAHERLAADGLAHHMIAHVRSSQAFALNLFAPLDREGLRAVAAVLDVDAVAVEEPRFEWSDPDDELGERTHASPHATQVDVRLDCKTTDGATVVCLVEVKLSEPDFNPCSAWLSSRNDRLDVCASSGPFGNDTDACFQLRNHDRDHRRSYDSALGPLVAMSGDEGGCWFRFGGNQIMRNAALARSLVTRGMAERAVVALCAPAAHRAIWRRWAEATSLLQLDHVSFRELPAHVVAARHANHDSVSGRYLLEESPLTDRC
jgi:hypothetical protein